MKLLRIGRSFAPSIIALTAMSGVATMANAQTRPAEINTKTEMVLTEKPDNKKFLPNFLLYMAIGAVGGAGLAFGEAKVRKYIKNRAVSPDNYYDIKFLKEGDKVDGYMTKLIYESEGNRPYYPDMEEFIQATEKFMKKYPSRKEDLFFALRTLSDMRLDDAQAELLCQHLTLRATCTADEWKNVNIFQFLDGLSNYDDMVYELIARTNGVNEENIGEEDADAEGPVKEADTETQQQRVQQEGPVTNISHNLTFKDVGGQDEVIRAIKRSILYPIKYPKAFEYNSLNHGFVLFGAPGTGKTLIAEALANEAKCFFIKLNGTELSSKWVGESESNWRKVFEVAKENQPSIIFIDEFDGVAGKRGSGDIHGDKVLNQILGLISGVEKNNDQIYIIATTNRLDKIDEAFLRPGRLGKHFELKPPQNENEILQILNIHLGKRPVADTLDRNGIAKNLLGMKATGADIAYLVNEAYENSMLRNQIYEKMDNGDFKDSDMTYVMIENADFDKVLGDFKSSRNEQKPIGFKKAGN